MKKYKAVDAFCGAGGLSLGLGGVGFKILLGFDLDKRCIETIQSNKRLVKHEAIQADVKDMLNGGLLRKLGIKKGELDLLAGGPPCQGFSVQRTIGEDADVRNLLVDDYGDLISEVMPKFFLMENVPGIGGKRGRETVQRFREKMMNLGYICHENVLDAQNYGVPQRRKRYVMVGEKAKPGAVKFEWPSALVGEPVTVRDVIGTLPEPPKDGSSHPKLPGHRADKLSEINKLRLMAISQGQGRDDLPEHLVAECHKRSSDEIGHRNVYGRMHWDEVAPTITARFDSFTRGKFGHPDQLRSISLYEGALLQTFPEDYVFVGSKVEVARQIGNAVPPGLAKAIGRQIYRALEGR